MGVATYLARYMRGGPIKSSRLTACDNQSVTFRYGDHRNADARGRAPDAEMTLSLEEFTRRWLPSRARERAASHPSLRPHHAYRDRLEVCRAQCGEDPSRKRRRKRLPPIENRCPVCNALLVEGARVPPSWLEIPVSTGLPPPVSTGLPPPTDQVSP